MHKLNAEPAGLFGKDRPPTIVKPERASPRMERFMHKLNAERVADDVVRPPPPKSLKKKENRLTLGQVGVATWFRSTKPPFTSYRYAAPGKDMRQRASLIVPGGWFPPSWTPPRARPRARMRTDSTSRTPSTR